MVHELAAQVFSCILTGMQKNPSPAFLLLCLLLPQEPAVTTEHLWAIIVQCNPVGKVTSLLVGEISLERNALVHEHPMWAAHCLYYKAMFLFMDS